MYTPFVYFPYFLNWYPKNRVHIFASSFLSLSFSFSSSLPSCPQRVNEASHIPKHKTPISLVVLVFFFRRHQRGNNLLPLNFRRDERGNSLFVFCRVRKEESRGAVGAAPIDRSAITGPNMLHLSFNFGPFVFLLDNSPPDHLVCYLCSCFFFHFQRLNWWLWKRRMWGWCWFKGNGGINFTLSQSASFFVMSE